MMTGQTTRNWARIISEAAQRHAGWSAFLSSAVLAALTAWMLWLRDTTPYAMTGTSIGGGALLYGLPGDGLFGFMPLAEIVQSLIDSTIGWGPRLIVPVITAILVIAGAAKAECPSRLAALAVFLTAIFWLPHTALVSTYDIEQFLYGSTILLLALALADEDGTVKSRWRIGATFALCICVRSPMLLFVPLLLLWRLTWRGGWRKPIGFLKEEALPLLGPTAAVLCLWTGVTLAATGRLSSPEGMRAASNVISGALGFVGTMEGDYRQLAGISYQDNPYLWALGHILKNPLTYLRAIPLRAQVAFNVAPLTACAAMAGMILFRAAPFYRAAGLITLYFLAVHCAMSVEGRYFSALLPLISATALALVFRLAGILFRLPEDYASGRKVFTHAINTVEFVLYTLLALALLLATAYPFRAKRWPNTPRSASFQESGYYYSFWGTKALMEKNYSVAADSYRQAAKLLPLRGHEKQFIWAAILAGNRKLLSPRTMEILGRDTPRAALVLVAAAAKAKDRQACEAALQFWMRNALRTNWFFRGNGKGGFNLQEQKGMADAKILFPPSEESDFRAMAETFSESELRVLISVMPNLKIPASSGVWLITRIPSDRYFEKASTRTNTAAGITDITRAAKAASNDQYVLVKAGAEAFGLHYNVKAEKWLKKAYGIDEKNRDAALSLINFYVLTGKRNLARRYCRQAEANGLFSDRTIADSCREADKTK